MRRLSKRLLWALTALHCFSAANVSAQETSATKETAPVELKGTKEGAEGRRQSRPSTGRLPADVVTHQSLDLPGRTLKFDTTAGSIPFSNAEGQVQAEMAYIAYTLVGGDPKTRPVAFVFNGGPGSSSAWLNLGALGPWRLPLSGDDATPSASTVTVANAETWLDFTDLVMIDPIGTGYSQFARSSGDQISGEGQTAGKSGAGRDELQKRYWSVDGDINSLADFIARWVAKAGRHASPKLLAGESYGGFRVPKIAHALQTDFGVGTNLLVIMSPVLDYGFLRGHRHMPINTVAMLPSLAAAAMEAHNKTPSAGQMREAEEYARGEYLADLMRGPRDTAAVDRIVERVATLTGLPAATVRRYGGRLDGFGYRREVNLSAGKVASAYDASVTGFDPEPASPNSRAEDPFITALRAPVTGAMLDIYASKLGWHTDARYQLGNNEVARRWQYGNSTSPPEAVSALKSAVALDPHLRVLVAHGYTDLVTPYFASTLILDQVPAYGDARRIVQITYPGGHMFYSRDASRAAFREDVLIMLAASLNGEARTR